MSSVKETMYKKRAGTSGMSGQLYKTKLASLVLFKLLHDERFEYFYLTSNMDEIGSFADLCFKAKIKGIDRPVLVFIQVKHKDDENSFVDFDDVMSFYDSYSKVKQRFNLNGKAESKDKIFDGKFDENECLFILYTNAKHTQDSNITFDSAYASTLNDLLATGKSGTHLHYSDKMIEKAAETISKPDTVPSLSFSLECSEMAKENLQKIVIYAQQSNHTKLEELIIKQIEENYNSNHSRNLQVRPEAIFLNYHAAVQAWWLLKYKAPYLTKQAQIYQDALNNIVHEPLMNSLKTAFIMTKMQNIEYTTYALEKLQLTRQKNESNELTLAEKTIIVTDVTTLTAIKVMQYLNYKGIRNYTLLDLNYTSNLSTDDFCTLKAELKKTDSYIIVICEKLQNGVAGYEKYLKEIAQALEGKQKVVITNSTFIDMVLVAFRLSEKENTQNENHDDNIIYEQISLIDFTQDSQKNIITNRKVLFQGQLTDLDLLINDTSSAFIEGPVLNKIILNETIDIGEPLSDRNYDEISHLYQDRTVEYTKMSQLIPGNICVTAVDYIFGDILLCKQEDQHIDSLLSINLLEDPNNYIYHIDSTDSKGPFYIDFIFICRVNLKKIEDDCINVIISLNKDDEASYRLSIKKNDIQNKVWIVKVTLFDCIKLFYKWQKDKKTDTDTLQTLRNLCEGVVNDNMFRNERPKWSYTKGALNTETINSLFKESNCEWHTFSSTLGMSRGLQKNTENVTASNQDPSNAGTSIDIEKQPSLASNEEELMQTKYFCKLDLNSDQFLCHSASVNTNASRDSGNVSNSLINEQANFNQSAAYNIGDEASTPDDVLDAQKKFLHNVSLHGTRKFYSVVPDITIPFYNDEPDNVVIVNEEANSDNSLLKTIIALPWQHNRPESEEVHVSNFRINYNYKYRMSVTAFNDVKDEVVLLTAKAGVGKSTLLAHLSQKQNKLKDNIWIVRINLLNYSGKLRKWQQDKKIKINALEALKFICQVIMKNKNISIDLKESCNKIYLESCSGDAWDQFNLNMFLHYYNERKLLMLFDGFDEICPDYKDEVMQLLQVVRHFPQSNKMWITSRPYNSILPELERHFGSSFIIARFNKIEQSQYLSNFWNKLTAKYINEYDIQKHLQLIAHIMPFIDNKLKEICYDFYKFIFKKFSLHLLLLKIPALKLCCEAIEAVYKHLELSVSSLSTLETRKFLSTPLLIYLSAHYFVTKVVILNDPDVPNSSVNLRNNLSIITMYENFIEIKLRNILFEDKCGLNVDIPFIKEAYESELQECMAIHKKLGAHAIYGNPLFMRFGIYLNEFKEMSPFKLDTEAGKKEFYTLIDRIWIGKERTGLISYVTSDHVPVFIHKTFAEFFAFEYVYDIIKSKKFDEKNKKLLLVVAMMVQSNNTVKDDCGDPVFSSSVWSSWITVKASQDNELRNMIGEVMRDWSQITEYMLKMQINRFISF